MTTSAVDTSTAKPEEAPLSFSAWFKNQTEALYGVNSQEGSPNSSIPEMFSDNAQIVVNDESFTADEFKKTLSSRTRFTRQNSLSWKDISVTTPDEDGTKEAVVVGTFIHTRSLNFRIRAGPAQLKTAVTFRAKIERVSGINSHTRQVTELYQTQRDEAVPVQIRGVSQHD